MWKNHRFGGDVACQTSKVDKLNLDIGFWFPTLRNPTFLLKDIILFGSPITPVNVVRNLGVTLDRNMTMSEHIACMCRNCYYQLRQIRRITRSLTANSKTLLVLASVHSRLDYCNSVLYQGCQPSVNLGTVRENLTQSDLSVKILECP